MPPATLFRYLAVRSISALIALFVILSSLIMLIDLVENLRFAGKVEDGNFSLAVGLTLMRVPSLVQTLAPFVFLFASIWTFYQLNKRSELSVIRSAGISIWRLIGPSAFIAICAGLAMIMIFDPISANLRASAEALKAQKEGGTESFVQLHDDGIWLRQPDRDTKLIINAASFDNANNTLVDLVVWRTDANNKLIERIDAAHAALSSGTLELSDVKIKSTDDGINRDAPIYAIPTRLTANDLRERIAPPETMSLWQLPKYIPLAEAAGLPTTRYHLRFHDLSSTPLKLLAMVLIAAAFSIRPVRSGGALMLIVLSLGSGFLLYLISEISSAIGESGVVPVALAAWAPAVIATIAATTALLHFEDG